MVEKGSDGTQQGISRGRNPASLRALTRQGKGRPAVFPEQIRTTHTFLLDNTAWNQLIDLASAQSLSVSRLIEQIGERSEWLLEPAGNWIESHRLTQIGLTEGQARVLPLITLLHCSFDQRRRKTHNRRSKTQKRASHGSARHSISLSATGWEGITVLALGINRSEPATIQFLGYQVNQLQQPLNYWLSQPQQSIMQQMIANQR
jgi:hypothetical protein